MSDTSEYTALAPIVEQATPRASRGQRLISPRRPLPPLPETAWLEVARIQVDPSYQHRPYARAVQDLAREFDIEQSGYILVNVREDGSYWAIDGQTRCAVHEELGHLLIRAELRRGLTPQQEAQVYLLRCKNIQRVPLDWFLAEFTAGKPDAIFLYKLLSERQIAVESFATEPQYEHTHAYVTCVHTLKRLMRHDPEGFWLGATLDLIIETWQYQKGSFGGQFIETIYGLLRQHDEEIDRKSFAIKLGQHSLKELNQMAGHLRFATHPQISLRSAMQRKIVELYNERRQGGGSPLELKLLMQQYERRAAFYAQETSKVLSMPSHVTLVMLLRILAEEKMPCAPIEFVAELKPYLRPEKVVNGHIHYCQWMLRKAASRGLVREIKEQGRGRLYVISDFARLVLTYMPAPAEPNPPAATPVVKKKRVYSHHVYHDWLKLQPEIMRLLNEGDTKKEIASKLGIPYVTLVRHCRLCPIE